MSKAVDAVRVILVLALIIGGAWVTHWVYLNFDEAYSNNSLAAFAALGLFVLLSVLLNSAYNKDKKGALIGLTVLLTLDALVFLSMVWEDKQESSDFSWIAVKAWGVIVAFIVVFAAAIRTDKVLDRSSGGDDSSSPAPAQPKLSRRERRKQKRDGEGGFIHEHGGVFEGSH